MSIKNEIHINVKHRISKATMFESFAEMELNGQNCDKKQKLRVNSLNLSRNKTN